LGLHLISDPGKKGIGWLGCNTNHPIWGHLNNLNHVMAMGYAQLQQGNHFEPHPGRVMNQRSVLTKWDGTRVKEFDLDVEGRKGLWITITTTITTTTTTITIIIIIIIIIHN